MRTEEDFIIGYLEAAEWCGIHDANEDAEEMASERDVDFTWDRDTAHEAAMDCLDFLATAPEGGIPEYGHPVYSDANLAGHDFWLTRNGHGAGFWDRGLGDLGKALTEHCKPYGEVCLFAGDDDVIYG